MMRVGVAGMWHETNTYSSQPTGMDRFAAFELCTGDEIVSHHFGTESVIGGFLTEPPFTIVPTFSAGAWPSGPAPADVGAELLDRLDRSMVQAGSLDGVLVNLHGAMVTDDRPDFEADSVGVIRARHPNVPIVCVLDFHANPSPQLVDLADVVISYDTYPHVDMHERGREAVGWMTRVLDGIEVATGLGKHPLLTMPLAQATGSAPMATIMANANVKAAELGIDRVCVTGGFPYSDVTRAGVSVLVNTTQNAGSIPELVASVLDDIEAAADEFIVERPDSATAVSQAIACQETPIVLADIADNIGGGSAGDSAAILEQLLTQHASDVLSIIADADVAHLAHDVGVGGSVSALVGGKTDEHHGVPMAISGTVKFLSDGRYRSAGTWGAGLDFEMGPTAVIQCDGVDLVVTERPVPPFHIEQVTHLGVDPSDYSIITAKGALAWRAAYGEIAKTVIEVDGPGVCPVDLTRLERATEPMRFP